jgi:sec-independent protein translocase protein TatA
MDLGAPELLIILVIVGLLFGANKLPGLARGMGSAVSEFKKGQAEGVTDAPKAAETPAVASPVDATVVDVEPTDHSPTDT